MIYLLLLWLHVIGATVLLGMGAGIAFFMLMAHRTRDPATVAHVAGTVVTADYLFTLSAVVAQPLTGAALINLAGWPPATPWIASALGLYVLTGLCWLPVVRLQVRLRDLARTAAADGTALPDTYDRLFRLWFVLGFPAFAAVLGIVWLMVAKPALWSST